MNIRFFQVTIRIAILGALAAALAACCSLAPNASSQSGAEPSPPPPSADAKTPIPPSAIPWFKGNIHTHTSDSDGDSSPIIVASWYRDHDYDFLVITDHNSLTQPKPLQDQLDAENTAAKHKPFLLIPGEEVTDYLKLQKGSIPLHFGAIGSTKKIGRQGGATKMEVAQKCVDAIHNAGGLALINHPNYGWALTADEINGIQNVSYFEVYNGHPFVNNYGGGGHLSTDQLWDNLLTRGRKYYATATDDAHHFKEYGPGKANAGRGWVVVRASSLTQENILKAINDADYYASTGVELENVVAENNSLSVKIRKFKNFGYRTEFIGKAGAILAASESLESTYTLKPGDLYVRARISDSGGRTAWTQPLFAAGH